MAQAGRPGGPQEAAVAPPLPAATGGTLVIGLDARGKLTGSRSGDARLLDERGLA
jgi:hypothetical protein